MKTDKGKTDGADTNTKETPHPKKTNFRNTGDASNKEVIPVKKLRASSAKPKANAFWNQRSCSKNTKPQNEHQRLKPVQEYCVDVIKLRRPENQQPLRSPNKRDTPSSAKKKKIDKSLKKDQSKWSTEKCMVSSTISAPKKIDSNKGNFKKKGQIIGSTEVCVIPSSSWAQKKVDPNKGKLKKKEQVKGSTEVCVAASTASAPKKVNPNRGNLKKHEQVQGSMEVCVAVNTSSALKKVNPNKGFLKKNEQVQGSMEECVVPSTKSAPKKKVDSNRGNLKKNEQVKGSMALAPKKVNPNKGFLKKNEQVQGSMEECVVPSTKSAPKKKVDSNRGNLKKNEQVKESMAPAPKKVNPNRGNLKKHEQVQGSMEVCVAASTSSAPKKVNRNKGNFEKNEQVNGRTEECIVPSTSLTGKKTNLNRRQCKAKPEISLDKTSNEKVIQAQSLQANLQKAETNNTVRQTGFKATCNAQISKKEKTTALQKGKTMGKAKCRKIIPKPEPEKEELVKVIKLTRSAAKLLKDGPEKFKDCPPTAVQGYLTRHQTVLRQFIEVIGCSEDVKERITTVEIMFELLIPHKTVKKSKKWAIQSSFDCIDNFKLLVDSMYVMGVKFCDYEDYQEALPELHIKMLHIISALCSIEKFEQEIMEIDQTTVHFLGELLAGNTQKEVADILLALYKMICTKRINCVYISNQLFCDGLYSNFQLSKKPSLMTSVLILLSKSRAAFKEMVKREAVIDLLLELLVAHNKTVNKNHLLTLLYKTTEYEHGRSILSKMRYISRLYNFFTLDAVHKDLERTLKCYSILNRSVKRTVLPTFKQTILSLPKRVLKHLRDEKTSDKNRPDIHSNDGESKLPAEDKHPTLHHTECLPVDRQASQKKKPLMPMKPFYTEFFEHRNFKHTKFDIYTEKGQLPLKEKIIQNVHRPACKIKLAYPDCSMLEATSDNRTVRRSAYNRLPLSHICYQLGCARELLQRTYVSHTVYDIDDVSKRPSTVELSEFRVVNAAEVLDQIRKNSLQFDSQFESGNLQKAVQIDKYEYELLVSPDTMTDQGNQWFYFCVSNIVNTIKYHFHIINFIRPQNMYNEGMRPIMLSVKEHQLHGTGWTRAGENIVYYGNSCTDEAGVRQYRTLSFTITFPHDNDHVYLASHYPYTYTRLMITLAPLLKPQSNVYTRVDRLCHTVTNMNEVPLLTITGDLSSSSLPLKKRPIVFISSRVHSGETNSSWIMEGIIDYLLHGTDEYAVAAREHFVFKIIPMLNPEGVIYGNCRRGLVGYDLNRCWKQPDEITCPAIFYTKKLIEYAKRHMKQPIAAFIDIHGHSRESYCFFYGCNPIKSWNPRDHQKGNCLDVLKLLPEAISTLNENINLASCKYGVAKYKESAARVVMWRQFGIRHSYTLECSYSHGAARKSINTKMLTNIGASVIGGLAKIVVELKKFKGSLPSMGLFFGQKRRKKSKKKEPQKKINLRVYNRLNYFNCQN